MGSSYWNKFKKGYTKFTERLKEDGIHVLSDFKKFTKNNPLADEAIKISLSFIPPPFNELARGLYDKYSATDKVDASKEVFEYLKNIHDRGEENFNDLKAFLKKLEKEGAKQENLIEVSREIMKHTKKLDEIKEDTRKISNDMIIVKHQLAENAIGMTIILQEIKELRKTSENGEKWTRPQN